MSRALPRSPAALTGLLGLLLVLGTASRAAADAAGGGGGGGQAAGVSAELLAALPWPLAAGTPVTDALTFARIVQQDFQSCGQDALPDPRLNDVATRLLGGFRIDRAAFGAAGFPVKAAGTVLVPRLSSWEKVLGSLSHQCGNRLGYSRFGVAVEGARAALVYARPAELDLSARARWNGELLRALNEARRQGQRCGDTLYPGTHPLSWSDPLARAAAQQVTELPQYNFRGHVNPVTGSTPPARARAAGWPGAEVAETLAYDALSPDEAVRTLLASPGHCRIIMDTRWAQVGLDLNNGTAGSAFTTYWAQVYSR